MVQDQFGTEKLNQGKLHVSSAKCSLMNHLTSHASPPSISGTINAYHIYDIITLFNKRKTTPMLPVQCITFFLQALLHLCGIL